MTKPRILIIGGTGYFGARLAQALSTTHDVTVTLRSSTPERLRWLERSGLHFVRYNSTEGPLQASGEFDAIVNLAMPGAAEAAKDPEAARTAALSTAQSCLQWLDSGRASRLLHFSSFHVYGAGGRQRFCETDPPSPIHPYGHAHWACEQLLSPDDRVCIVRPSNMVGAPAHADLGDQAGLLFVDLCRQAAQGSMKLHNDGLSYRDFLPFEDAISAVRLLLSAPAQPQRLFNLACGHSMRLDEAARLIQQASNTSPPLDFGSGQDAFRQPFTIDINRLCNLGWHPTASLANEASKLIQFFL
jgi:nucleoside-diphosphate-sugar epimerase